MNDLGTLYGRGIGFGVTLDRDGRLAMSEGPENIREAIQIILSTEPGERLLRPAFGAGLRTFLFEPNTPATHRLIEERIVRSITRWEPRIRLESVEVTAHPIDLTQALALIRYRLVATAEPSSLSVGIDIGQVTP